MGGWMLELGKVIVIEKFNKAKLPFYIGKIAYF
jgi:hypothetical protein